MENNKYRELEFRFAGKSGLMLPIVSLGLWNNFSDKDNYANMKDMVHTSFELGITHFDLANNYGPPAGAAETNFGRILKEGLSSHRDEILVSSKAGHFMWDGPYGNGGSRKYLTASIDQSLKRTGLEYFDIFYHHRFDINTPLEETASALDSIVKQGKALYIGVSNYNGEQLRTIKELFDKLGTPFILHQPPYSIARRTIETNGALEAASELGFGTIVFSPLAQGLLTNRYFDSIPKDSRAGKKLWGMDNLVNPETISRVKKLNDIAQARGQTLAQMALSWALKAKSVVSVLIGASSVSQIKENIKLNYNFTSEELKAIDSIKIDNA